MGIAVSSKMAARLYHLSSDCGNRLHLTLSSGQTINLKPVRSESNKLSPSTHADTIS